MSAKILVIIPAYNEEECILNTCNSIFEYNKSNETDYHVLVVNDGSKDSTLQILQENHIPHISLVHNLGIGGAVQTGYKYALDNDFDIAVQYDGDGQHDVSYIRDITAPIIQGDAQFVIGSRFVDKSSSDFQSTFARRMGISILSAIIKLFTRTKLYDVTSGFRASGKDIIKLFATKYPTDYPEPTTNMQIVKLGYAVKEVPVSMNERAGGESSISSWKSVYYMINVILTLLVIGLRGKQYE